MDKHAKLAEIIDWISRLKCDATTIDWKQFETYYNWLVEQLENKSGLMDYKSAVAASLADLRNIDKLGSGLGKLVAKQLIKQRLSNDHE